jgi:hypothetical protein
VILGCILALTERLVCRRLENLCAGRGRLFKVLIDIVNVDKNVLVDPVTRRPKRSSTFANHDSTLADRKLRMGDRAIRSWRSQTFNETRTLCKAT